MVEMSTEEIQVVDALNNREKEIYRTLDVFSHGVSNSKSLVVEDSNREVTEASQLDCEVNSQGDYQVTSQSSILNIVSQTIVDDQDNNNVITEEQLSDHELLNLQTGAKLYHGDGFPVTIEEEKEDEVEEHIQRFLAVPTETSPEPPNQAKGSKEVTCFLWYPDDDRQPVCEEALEYLRMGIGSRGLSLNAETIDLSRFQVDFPVLIFCLPPYNTPNQLSVGEMSVALVVIHQDPPLPGNPDTPLADDLYWRRYRNLSLILDLVITRGIFHSSRTNSKSISNLLEFLNM